MPQRSSGVESCGGPELELALPRQLHALSEQHFHARPACLSLELAVSGFSGFYQATSSGSNLRVKAGSLERLVQQYVNAADAPLVARFPTTRQADTTVVDGDAAFAKIPAALSTGVSAARAALRGSSNAGGHNNNNGHSNAVFHRGVGVDCSVSSASASN